MSVDDSKRVACLAIHGLGGGPHELAPLVEALRGAGHEVLAPVLPGHDAPGERMPSSRWEEWAEVVERGHDELKARHSAVACVGFSTGATLLLELASRRGVDRLLLLAPFLAIRYSGLLPVRPERYLRVLARVMPDLPRRGPALRDRGARREAARVERYRTFSVPATLSALELIERVRPLVSGIRCPALILQGRRDSVVEPSGAEWLRANLGSLEKRLEWFERSDHLLLLDHDRAAVRERAMAFLTRQGVAGGGADSS